MALIDLQTDLKSLKYGNDRPAGGNSRQPFITKKIPERGEHSDAPDFLLRNGFLNPVNSATDVLRIGKFLSTISGINFIAKQQALILTGPLSLGGRTAQPLGSQINIAYNPIQTLAQVGGNSLGLHSERTGLAKKPDGTFDPLSLLPDFDNYQIKYDYLQNYEYSGQDNRLENLYNNLILKGGEVTAKAKNTFGIETSDDNLLFKYIGGPNINVLGGGFTLIKRTSFTNNPSTQSGNPRPVEIQYGNIIFQGFSQKYIDITGEGEENLITNVVSEDGGLLFTPNVYLPGTLTVDEPNLKKKTSGPYQFEGNDLNKLGVSYLYSSSLKDIRTEDDTVFISDFALPEELGIDGNNKINNANNVYLPGEFPKTNKNLIQKDKSATLNQEQLISSLPIGKGGTNYIEDFRKRLQGDEIPSSFRPATTDYTQFNREDTYLTGNPGKRSVRRIDYNVGPQDIIENTPDKSGRDRINLYDSTTRNSEIEQGDLIQFNMRVINNDSLEDEFIYFRAFIDDFSETYTADWNEYQYVGRAQKFFTYKGFDRSYSLGFTVYAQSREELLPIYRKLNRLASVTSADYSKSGYMRGSILKLTVGDYITNHPGILKGFTVSNMMDFGWEIARDANGKRITDKSIQQLPMGFKITGFNFTSVTGGGLSSSNYIPGKGSSFVGLGLGA